MSAEQDKDPILARALETYSQAVLDHLPYVRPRFRPEDALIEYKDKYGVDLEGASALHDSEPMPNINNSSSVEGLSCMIK